MKLEIESPVSRYVIPTCLSDRGCVEDQPQHVRTATVYAPFRHRAIIRARRRRRGFGGPLRTF